MKLHPSRFDITNTVVTTLLTFEQKIDEKGIEIRGLEEAAPQEVWGDQDLLHQVVYNLIENAVKFTNEGAISPCRSATASTAPRWSLKTAARALPPRTCP